MISYVTDPILRAPTLGCMFMCLASSLMGVVLFLQKRSLLGESLSHAAYPGVALGMGLAAACGIQGEISLAVLVFSGACICSVLGLKAIHAMTGRGRVSQDAALTFVLASLFGAGVLAASWLQEFHPQSAKQAQMYLYGQAATMVDAHIALYGALAALVLLFAAAFYRPLQALLFDRTFAACAGIAPKGLQGILFALLVLATVIGIRSVGVVLMAGMLIAPAAAARQFTDRLSTLFWGAGVFGMLSGLFGNILSVEGAEFLSRAFPEEKLSLPTGPMIVLVGTAFAVLSLLFAPRRGVLFRGIRVFLFRRKCLEENLLKELWKKKALAGFSLRLWNMQRRGWTRREGGAFVLTADGEKRAARIVRLHRLWETYLAELGWSDRQVHRTAEEMEHILTSDIEKKLSRELGDPKLDPHAQPIPENYP